MLIAPKKKLAFNIHDFEWNYYAIPQPLESFQMFPRIVWNLQKNQENLAMIQNWNQAMISPTLTNWQMKKKIKKKIYIYIITPIGVVTSVTNV